MAESKEEESCMNEQEVVAAVDKSGAEPIRVIGILDPEPCKGDLAAKEHGIKHVSGVVTADDTRITADDAIALIDAGRVLDMIPPPGAPAHAAHVATGFPLMLQVRTCELCGKRVLFA